MSMLLTAAEGIDRRLRTLARYMSELAGWSFLVGALFVTFNVISRRYLGFSSPAMVEITGYILAFGIAWGLANTFATKGHIRVDVLVNKLPLVARSLMHTLALSFLFAFSLLLAVRAVQLVSQSFVMGATDTSLLSVPLVIPQAAWCVGLVVFTITVAVTLARAGLLLFRGRFADVDALLGPISEVDEAAALVAELEAEGASEQSGHVEV
jgi:TRAP-type C4-dicarboxylate transport system permease small subunit